jgi:7-carboxy-7-deazaguanine synthase
MTVEDVIEEVTRLTACLLVEITGGEPLLQEEIYPLVKRLLDLNYTVLVETNGSLDIGRLDSRAVRIMDIKTPKSGMADKMDFENIGRLTKDDEVKFVISDRKDYEWSKGILRRYRFPCEVLFSPVHGRLDPDILSEWILQDDLPVRLNLQLHKYIWGDKKRRL